MINIYIVSAMVVGMVGCLMNFILKINWVNKLFYLILVYILSALLMITMNQDFLGLILIIVYVGAILIFFLFVVMLLTTTNKDEKDRSTYIVLGMLIASILIYYILDNYNIEIVRVSNDTMYLVEDSMYNMIGFLLLRTYSELLIPIGLILSLTVVVLIMIY